MFASAALPLPALGSIPLVSVDVWLSSVGLNRAGSSIQKANFGKMLKYYFALALQAWCLTKMCCFSLIEEVIRKYAFPLRDCGNAGYRMPVIIGKFPSSSCHKHSTPYACCVF